MYKKVLFLFVITMLYDLIANEEPIKNINEFDYNYM